MPCPPACLPAYLEKKTSSSSSRELGRRRWQFWMKMKWWYGLQHLTFSSSRQLSFVSSTPCHAMLRHASLIRSFIHSFARLIINQLHSSFVLSCSSTTATSLPARQKAGAEPSKSKFYLEIINKLLLLVKVCQYRSRLAESKQARENWNWLFTPIQVRTDRVVVACQHGFSFWNQGKWVFSLACLFVRLFFTKLHVVMWVRMAVKIRIQSQKQSINMFAKMMVEKPSKCEQEIDLNSTWLWLSTGWQDKQRQASWLSLAVAIRLAPLRSSWYW